MIETTLYAVLKADPAVAALVVSGGETRIYPLEVPQDVAMPAVVYQRIASAPEVTLAGDVGLDAVRIQVSCWAATYSVAKELAAAVRAAVNASNLRAVTEMELDDRDTETRQYRVIIDFRIWQ
jgi:hypothetical protein